jgi:hypothetical protein
MTLKRFLRTYNKGTYIISINRHAFAVIDGIVNDIHEVRLGSHIREYWEF